MSTARFSPQGTGANDKPHLLVARLDRYASGAVQWNVKCPHEGNRECGAVVDCNGTPDDVERWGCELYPETPGETPAPDGEGGYEYSEEGSEAWKKFEKARERWVYEVHDGFEWHHGSECWFEHVITSNGDFDPEYFLAELPDGMEVNSPIKVIVGYEGYGEDVEPVLRLWEEPTDDQS